jgi:hypothetical protein
VLDKSPVPPAFSAKDIPGGGTQVLNVPRLIRPIQQSKKMVEQAVHTVNIMETRRDKGIKKQ